MKHKELKSQIPHRSFKLNENSFHSVKEVLTYAKSISEDIHAFFKEWFDKGDYLDVHTSGSTGVPKLIRLKKEHIVNSALATGKFFNLGEETTALLCLSPNYIAGKMMLIRAMVLGWELDVVEPVSNPLKGKNKVYDFSAMVPMQLHYSLVDIHKVKKLIVGGGQATAELQNRIQNISTEIYATYGMTETITHIAVKKLNQFNPVISSTSIALSTGSVEKSYYKLVPNVKISMDSRGCLVIDAPKVCDEQLVTNDLVELVSDDEFKWLGRYDNIINSGGVKLVPEQIEEKLSAVIKDRFFISSVPDTILGEKVVLLIEGKPFKIQSSTFQSYLEKYEIPKEIYFVDQFVETATKKIQRQKTLDLLRF